MAEITATTAITDDELPKSLRSGNGRIGRWTADIEAAIKDGKVRKTTLDLPDDLSDDERKGVFDTVRRQMAHQANSFGKGFASRVQGNDLYWQIAEKKERKPSDSATVGASGDAPTPEPAPAPGAGSPVPKGKR